jgi:hypothetical protein
MHPGDAQLVATLAEHRDEAYLYKKLATLIDAVPLKDSLDDLKFRGVPRARFERWCEELGARGSSRCRDDGHDWVSRGTPRTNLWTTVLQAHPATGSFAMSGNLVNKLTVFFRCEELPKLHTCRSDNL